MAGHQRRGAQRERGRWPVCQKPLKQAGRGRPRRYCANSCRQVAYRERKGEQRRRRLVQLVEADARIWLPTLPDESIDLVITDPPYRFDRGQTYFRDWFPELRDEEWCQIFRHLYRVLRPNSHCYVFCDARAEPLFAAAGDQAGFRVRTPLVWDKGSIGLGGGAWRAQYEHIAFYEKGSRSGNFRNRANVLSAKRVRRGYPTEKPISVLTQLIEQASRREELVLDPFCGSGGVGGAARQLHRRAILCDVDASYAAARLRLVPRRSAGAIRDE